MTVNTSLIVDVGMHRGEDTTYYLKKGFNVIAIDADPNTISYVGKKFAPEIKSGQLIILHNAVTNTDDKQVEFNVSELSIWSSLNKQIANRNNYVKNTVAVDSITLKRIFETYGTPYYCKIDIEGYDEICVETLKNYPTLPTFISVETECVGENEIILEEKSLATLNRLYEIGYKKFKLVDQTSLEVLAPETDFYSHAELLKFKSPSISTKIINKLQKIVGIQPKLSAYRSSLKKKFNHHFFVGSSGPFGNDLEGEWLDFETAKACLLKHRTDYFRLPNAVSYGFWCDWHATF